MNCNQSMYNYLLENMADREDYPAVVFFGSKTLMSTLISHIEKLAGSLAVRGVKKKDKIVLCLPNIPDAFIIFYAANKLGAIVNIVHPLMPSGALARIVRDIDAKYVFMLDDLFEPYKTDLSRTDATVVLCSGSDYLTGVKKLAYSARDFIKHNALYSNNNYLRFKDLINTGMKIEGDSEGKDVAAFMHSGGTTGTPKTVMLTNFALNSHTNNCMNLFSEKKKFTHNDAILMVLPMFHGFGLGVCMHTVLCLGSKVVLMPKFSARKANLYISKYKISILAGVPNMFQKMYNENNFSGKHLKNIKNIFCGGDKLPQILKDNFDHEIKKHGGKTEIFEGYGLTEMVAVCAVNSKQENRVGSVGKAVGDVKIVSVNEKNEILEPNRAGEICIHGDSMMKGYFKDKATTSKTIVKLSDNNTYVKTGDYGYLDNDGYIYFIDRIKRMIKISGVNVYPSEVEETISKMKEVKKCCAIRSTIDGKKVIKALVILSSSSKNDKNIKAKIITYCKKYLFRYSIPREIVIVDNLPVTSIGKNDYLALEKMFVD